MAVRILNVAALAVVVVCSVGACSRSDEADSTDPAADTSMVSTTEVGGEDGPLDEDVVFGNDTTSDVASDTVPATPPPADSPAAAPTTLTRDDFLNIDVPSFCDHPAGTLNNGELEMGSDGNRAPGYLSLDGVEPGQLDDDADYEYVVTFACSQGGVGWPSLVALYDGDQTLLAYFQMNEMYETGPWRGAVSFSWNPDDRLFFGDAYYEVSGTEGYESWSVIESSTCTVAFDPETRNLETYNPLGGEASCREGTGIATYQERALGAGLGETIDLVTGQVIDPVARPDGDSAAGNGDSSGSGSSDGVTPGAPDPAAIACDSAEEVFGNYLVAAGARDYSSAWSFLAQSDKDDYGSFERFANFWDTVSLVGIEEERPISSSADQASTEFIMFYDIDTGRQYERVQVDTTCDGGISKIADYRFIEIVQY